MASTLTPIPNVGEEAPGFNLPDADMKTRSLEEFRGRKLVLAFFPAAESSVCTTEMCKLRDSQSSLKSLGAQVVGISVDGPFANKTFRENNHLNFPILSDYKREVIKRYGIIMANLGSLVDYNAAKRSVFVLDESGTIRYKWVSENPLVEPKYDEIKSVLEK
jgi:peroxiredoxin